MDWSKKLLSPLQSSGAPGGRGSPNAPRQELDSRQRRRSGLAAAEDVQFASINQRVGTPEGTALAAHGMSLEPLLSQMWASVESDADPTAGGGMIECSAGAVGGG